MPTTSKPKTPAKLTVDFSNVEERREGGGSAAHVPAGDYLLQVVGCDLRSKKDDRASRYLNWRLVTVRGVGGEKYKGKTIYHITSLKPEALWNLRNFLEDMGLRVEKSAMDIPLAKILAKKPIIGATLEDDEYNDKVKSKISATFKKSQFEETEEDEAEDEESDDEEAADSDDEEDDDSLEELDTDDL